jgi:hypothetical protein
MTASVTVGALGWIGFCFGAVLLAMGERGPALVVYGLIPTLLSLAVLAAGGRLWSRSGNQAPLGIYVGAAFLTAVGGIALIWAGSIVAFHFRR